MSRKWDRQRDVCGWWAEKTLCFHGTLCSSLPCTGPLAGHRCALHRDRKPAEPGYGGFWVPECIGVMQDSSEFRWAAAHPRDWFPVSVNGTPEWRLCQAVLYHCRATGVWRKGKCAALGLVLGAIFTPLDVSVSVSRISPGVPLLGVTCGAVLTTLGLGDNECILTLVEKCRILISAESRTEKCLQWRSSEENRRKWTTAYTCEWNFVLPLLLVQRTGVTTKDMESKVLSENW